MTREEFAKKWVDGYDWLVKGIGKDGYSKEDMLDDLDSLSLTALISEHYYPKEFLLWTGENCQYYPDTNEWMYFESPMTQQYFKGTDELYNYWANNEE